MIKSTGIMLKVKVLCQRNFDIKMFGNTFKRIIYFNCFLITTQVCFGQGGYPQVKIQLKKGICDNVIYKAKYYRNGEVLTSTYTYYYPSTVRKRKIKGTSLFFPETDISCFRSCYETYDSNLVSAMPPYYYKFDSAGYMVQSYDYSENMFTGLHCDTTYYFYNERGLLDSAVTKGEAEISIYCGTTRINWHDWDYIIETWKYGKNSLPVEHHMTVVLFSGDQKKKKTFFTYNGDILKTAIHYEYNDEANDWIKYEEGEYTCK